LYCIFTTSGESLSTAPPRPPAGGSLAAGAPHGRPRPAATGRLLRTAQRRSPRPPAPRTTTHPEPRPLRETTPRTPALRDPPPTGGKTWRALPLLSPSVPPRLSWHRPPWGPIRRFRPAPDTFLYRSTKSCLLRRRFPRRPSRRAPQGVAAQSHPHGPQRHHVLRLDVAKTHVEPQAQQKLPLLGRFRRLPNDVIGRGQRPQQLLPKRRPQPPVPVENADAPAGVPRLDDDFPRPGLQVRRGLFGQLRGPGLPVRILFARFAQHAEPRVPRPSDQLPPQPRLHLDGAVRHFHEREPGPAAPAEKRVRLALEHRRLQKRAPRV